MLIWDLIPPWSVDFSSVYSYVSWRQVSLGSYWLLAPNFFMLKSTPSSWTVSKFYPFLPTAFMNTKIIQAPRYLVMGRANNKSLDCEQHLGNNAMYWYQQKAGNPQSSCFSTVLKTWFEMRLCPFVSYLNAQTPPSYSFTCLAWSQKTQLCIGVRAARTQPCRFISSLYTNLQVQETVGQLRASLNISCRTQDRCCKP